MTQSIDTHKFQEEVLNATGLHIVKFYTEWSGSCQMMVPIYNELSNSYRGAVKFHRVDVEAEPLLKKQLGVNELPTFLFFKNGAIIDFVNGIISKNAFIAKLENALTTIKQ